MEPINCTTRNCSTSCNKWQSKMLLYQNLDHITSLLKISLEEMFQRMYKHNFGESETVVSDSILKNVSETSTHHC